MVDNFKLVTSDSEFYTIVESSSDKYAYRDIDYDQRGITIPLYNLKFYYNDKNFIVDKSFIAARLNRISKTISTSEEIKMKSEKTGLDSDEYVLVYIKYAIPINSELGNDVDLHLITNYYDNKKFEVDELPFANYNFETKEINNSSDDISEMSDAASIASETSVMTESLDTDSDRYSIVKSGDKRYARLKNIDRTKPYKLYNLISYERAGRFIVDKDREIGIVDEPNKKFKLFKPEEVSDYKDYKISKIGDKKYAALRNADLTKNVDLYELESYENSKLFQVKNKNSPIGYFNMNTKKVKIFDK